MRIHQIYTHYSQLLLQTCFPSWGRAKNRFKANLYQVDVQNKHAQKVKQFNSAKRNNIKRRHSEILYWCNTRSSRRTCLSRNISNLLACHPSQLLAVCRVLFVQALQTSIKTTNFWLVTCSKGRAKILAYCATAYWRSSRLFTRSQFSWLFSSCTLHGGFLRCLWRVSV